MQTVLQDGGNSEGLSFLTSKYVPNPQHRAQPPQLSSLRFILMLHGRSTHQCYNKMLACQMARLLWPLTATMTDDAYCGSVRGPYAEMVCEPENPLHKGDAENNLAFACRI